MVNFNDPQIWVAFSFILFFAFFGGFIWKKFTYFLDSKINSINDEIITANNLHKEAKDLLSEEMKKFQGLENQIHIILEDGKQKAQDLYIENKDKINSEIIKLEKSSLEKMSYDEKQVVNELQAKITERAIQLTEKFLLEKSDNASHNDIINNSLKEVELNLKKSSNKFIQ